MKLLFSLMLGLAIGLPVDAALVTSRSDTDVATPTVDGVISANEYGPGNAYSFTGGGTGFGGQLGAATMYMKSNVTNLYVAFSGLGIPADGNRYLAYFHTRAGGFQPNGEMSDVTDGGRSNVSFLSSGGLETVSFEDGGISNKPDFALFFYNNPTGFQAIVELRGVGQTHVVIPRVVAGLGTSNVEFRISRASLGLAISGTVDVAAMEISPTGFLANEGIPVTGIGSNNPGFNIGGDIVFSNFHRFVVTDLSTPVGLTQRVANTTLKMPSTLPAEGSNSYSTADAFPGLTFSSPVALATPPGETNRLFIVEQAGRILVITNLVNPTTNVFMDIRSRCSSSFDERGLLGLAFHTNYAANGYFYVFYTAAGNNQTNRVARYSVMPGNASAGDTNSEVLLISQLDESGNHNGGDVHFGPDGYLYVSLGDEGGCNDSRNNSQRINKDFFSGILRIDVDKRPGNPPPNHHVSIVAPTNYAIPFDNPFIGATQFNGIAVTASTVRTEFYAVGLRNPFRMAFDEVTGELFAGDVGQDNREEIDYIVKGGNYGWKYREGTVATLDPGPCGTAIGSLPGLINARNPMIDYARTGASTNIGTVVTGGRIYRGDRFPELVGKYIFCDYGSGNIWMLTNNTTNATTFARIAGDTGISAFGRDPRNGDLLMCDHNNASVGGGRIVRLERTSSTNSLPATLADTGAFVDLPSLTPFPGIVPYDLNVPFWSDNARKTRWFSVPSTNLSVTFSDNDPWSAPTSTIWIKHFDLELTNGVASSARRIETRFLVKNADGNGGYGVTYRWGSSTTNATLVSSGGLDEPLVINDSGIIRTQVWHYPSRNECLQCHQAPAGFALGFNTVQLNLDRNYNGITTNQIRAMNTSGYFTTNVTGFHSFGKLAHATNAAHSLEFRVRSYLQANCRQCHFPGPATWDARITTPTYLANIVNGPLNNSFGSTNNRVIVPGSLTNSVLHTRIGFRGAGQMPPLGSNLVDTQGVALVAAWIASTLTTYETYAAWQIRFFGSTNNPEGMASADPDFDGNDNNLEFLTGSNPTNFIVDDAWTMLVNVTNGLTQIEFPRIVNRSFEVQVSTNLIDATWMFLDVPENTPFFSSSSSLGTVSDPNGTNLTERYYRMRVIAP